MGWNSGMSCTSDTTDFRGGVWGAATADDDDNVTLGPAMQIRFQSSDLSSLATHPLTPGLTFSSSSATTTNAAFTTTATPASPSGTTTGGFAASTAAASVSVGSKTATATRSGALQSSTVVPGGSTNASTQTVGSILQPTNLAIAYGKGIDNGSPIDAGLVAVIVSIVAASLVICVLLVLRMRGSRLWHWFRARAPWGGASGSLVSVGVGAWIGRPRRRAGDEEHGRSSPDGDPRPGVSVERHDESSTPAPARPPSVAVVEKNKPPPLGTADNPAELDGGLDQQRQRLSQRASWVSRMLSRVARSSTTTRSTSTSRWTQRSLARSGGWEVFMEEGSEGAEGEGEEKEKMKKKREKERKSEWLEFEGQHHQVLTVPQGGPAARSSRPATMFSSSDAGAAGHQDAAGSRGRLSVPVAVPTRFRSFDRLSQGTFGMVKVRGRSPSAGPSTRE